MLKAQTVPTILEVQAPEALLAAIYWSFSITIQCSVRTAVAISGSASVSTIVISIIWSSRIVRQILLICGTLVAIHGLAFFDGWAFTEALWDVMLGSDTWKQIEQEAKDIEGEDERDRPFEHSCYIVCVREVCCGEGDCERNFD